MNYRIVAKHLGLLLIVLTSGMLAPAGWWLYSHWQRLDPADPVLAAFEVSLCVGLVIGWLLARYGRNETAEIRRREALVLVAASWLVGAAIAALPYYAWAFARDADPGELPHAFESWVNCYFEAVSGLTTTGATVLDKIGTVPESLLFWRAMTQWLGGLGIIVLFVAVLPLLGVGGKRLFRLETPGPTPAGVTPRIRSTAQILWMIYLFMTVAETLLLRWQGMTWFDATCHTFTTLSTGGFSTRDASVGGFQSPGIETVIIVFMIAAGVNFGLYYHVLHGKWKTAWRDPELRAYALVLVVATFIVLVSLRGMVVTTTGNESQAGLTAHLRHGIFQVVSIQTTTGFGTADFDRWPVAAKLTLVALMFVGGCGGSTAGGIKVMRCLLAAKVCWAELERVFRPNVVRAVRIGRATVDPDMRLATLVYVVGIVAIFVLGTAGLLLLGPPGDEHHLTTAITACAASLNNIGPGLAAVGPTHTFADFSPAAKLLMTLLMAVGRLEMFPLLALTMPRFWRSE